MLGLETQLRCRNMHIGEDELPALDFAPEAYRVTVFDGATAVRTLATATPAAAYTAAEQIADFGASPASFTFTVAQVSAEYGAGHAAQGEFHD